MHLKLAPNHSLYTAVISLIYKKGKDDLDPSGY